MGGEQNELIVTNQIWLYAPDRLSITYSLKIHLGRNSVAT